ncbi:MAG TPA: hypothetical protein VG733_15615 [Chthoniobacteraceae bacterium]|nr:hypothetical protein [Chthoniobacteraceae bacterium]
MAKAAMFELLHILGMIAAGVVRAGEFLANALDALDAVFHAGRGIRWLTSAKYRRSFSNRDRFVLPPK